MSNGQIIKAVKLDLDGKEVDLTIEQAKKLQAALNEIFGEKVVKTVVHEYPYSLFPVTTPIPTYWYGEPCQWPNYGQPVIGDVLDQFTSTSGVVATFAAQSDSGTMTLKVA